MGKSSFFKIFLITITLSSVLYILKNNNNKEVNYKFKRRILMTIKDPYLQS